MMSLDKVEDLFFKMWDIEIEIGRLRRELNGGVSEAVVELISKYRRIEKRFIRRGLVEYNDENKNLMI